MLLTKNKKIRTLIALSLIGTNFVAIPTASAGFLNDVDNFFGTNTFGGRTESEIDQKQKDHNAEIGDWGSSGNGAAAQQAVSNLDGAASGAIGAAQAGAGVVSEAKGQFDSLRDKTESMMNVTAAEPAKVTQPEADNTANLTKRASGTDLAAQRAVDGAKLPTATLKKVHLDENGKVVEDDDEDSEKDSLAVTNRRILKDAQQVNDTSKTENQTYVVQSGNGDSVMVTKNPCYNQNTQQCMSNYTVTYTDENNRQQTIQQPLSTMEYLAGSTYVTPDMIQQARRQEAYNDVTNNALNNGTDVTKVDPIESVTGTVREMVAGGADPKQAIMSGLLTYFSQTQNSDTINQVKEYSKGMKEIQQAKDNAVYSKMEAAQEKAGVIAMAKNKRFAVRLTPAVPVINSQQDVQVELVTPSGKQNTDDYSIMVRVDNQKTGKPESFEVKENVPFVVEKAEWTTRPGRRTVWVFYKAKNSASVEKYSFSYKVGQMATAILPSGKAVTNSVVALAGNADVLNYGNSGQAVAGRIKDMKWDNGTCFMEITDAKDDANVKWTSVVVATNNIEQNQCVDGLKGNYISMGKVTAQLNDDGQYVFTDMSDGSQVSVMSEAEYDNLEGANATLTEAQGDKWDNTVLKVSEDGTIYEGLPGKLGVDFLNLNTGAGKNINIAISKSPDGGWRFSKADGKAYSDEELLVKGIDPSTISMGQDPNGVVYAYDTASGKLLSNNFSANDAAVLSKFVADESNSDLNTVSTNGSLTNKALSAKIGESGKIVGTISSMFNSAINGTKRAVMTLTGNVSSVGSGLFASIGTAGVGTTSTLSTQTKEAAEKAAIQICSTVPDRCEEAMAAAKAS